MNDHEHDEDCMIGDNPRGDRPNWRFSVWELFGIFFAVIAGFGMIVQQGCNMIAREFYALANWSRDQKDIKAGRRLLEKADRERSAERLQMAESLRGMIDDASLPVVDEDPS